MLSDLTTQNELKTVYSTTVRSTIQNGQPLAERKVLYTVLNRSYRVLTNLPLINSTDNSSAKFPLWTHPFPATLPSTAQENSRIPWHQSDIFFRSYLMRNTPHNKDHSFFPPHSQHHQRNFLLCHHYHLQWTDLQTLNKKNKKTRSSLNTWLRQEPYLLLPHTIHSCPTLKDHWTKDRMRQNHYKLTNYKQQKRQGIP